MANKFGVPPLQFSVFPLLVLVVILQAKWSQAALLQGCDFGDELCDQGEVCIPDGLFGQCYSDPEAALIRPLILDRALTDAQSEMLRRELGRLAEDGLDWPHARSQCILAYFKLSVAFQLEYDEQFCSVRDPTNIWALVQRVQNALLAEEEEEEEEEEEGGVGDGQQAEEIAGKGEGGIDGMDEEDDGIGIGNNGDNAGEDASDAETPSLLLTNGEGEENGDVEDDDEPVEQIELIPVLLLEPNEEAEQPNYKMAIANNSSSTNGANQTKEATEEKRNGGKEEGKDNSNSRGLAPEEEAQLDKLLHKLLQNRQQNGAKPEATGLNQRQLARLVAFVRQLQNLLLDEAEKEGGEEEEGAHQSEDDDVNGNGNANDDGTPVMVLKKDTEQFNNDDMGLAHTVHKIVKGGIQRVEGNRVYLRVEKENLTEEELYKLIAYLDRKIAAPNRLYFDQFLYQDGQLSFRISRSLPTAKSRTKMSPQLGSASGVAQAVYKRRKDIQTLAGVRVDETGIGSGQDVVPVERSQRDQLFLPILAVCAMTICALLSVLAASLLSRHRRRNQQKGTAPVLPHTIGQMDGKIYEELCRQRASDCPQAVVAVVEAGGGQRSKHSSTSSWPGDEPGTTGTDLDIGTGHVLLAFLQKYLEKQGEMTKQWESVQNYTAQEAQMEVAKKPENMAKNGDARVLPYDESRVKLHEKVEESGVPTDVGSDYVNASVIYDSDPEHPAYIAAQAPIDSTVAQFWQMIWEQGIGLLVNLCDSQESTVGEYAKYWPEEGSKVFGKFEIHLVSEHIWSEHYVVRSLYLKNTGTQETRTVTQFHFLNWPAAGVPGSSRALLEFRRKVNKSYRGRATPVLVHCINGGDRTGTYILIDMTINRIQKGVKELNIAASLEHLRDQRMGTVKNEQQFKCVFSCVADEISSMLKGLQH